MPLQYVALLRNLHRNYSFSRLTVLAPTISRICTELPNFVERGTNLSNEAGTILDATRYNFPPSLGYHCDGSIIFTTSPPKSPSAAYQCPCGHRRNAGLQSRRGLLLSGSRTRCFAKPLSIITANSSFPHHVDCSARTLGLSRAVAASSASAI